MAFKLVPAKLTGSPGESGWSQIHEFRPEGNDKLEKRGHLFAVISTSKQEEGIDSVASGREILSRLHEEYFGKIDSPPLPAIKDAVSKVVDEFSGSDWGEIEVAAISVIDDVVYCSAAGGARVLIFRDGVLAPILSGEKDKATSASGHPHSEDVLVLATSSFFEAFSDGVVKGALAGKDPSSAVESLAPTVHSTEQNGSLGLVFVKFEEPQKGASIEKVASDKNEGLDTTPAPSTTAGDGRKLGGLLAQLKSKLPSRKVYVGGTDEVSAKRKVPASVGIILVVLLLVSIGFGINKKKEADFRQSYESELQQAEHDLEESLSLYTLDPKRSRELFLQSKEKVEILTQKEVEDQRLEELRAKIIENEGRVLGEYTENLELFVNLSLLSDGFNGDALAGDNENLIVLDSEGRRIIETDIETKRSRVVAGPDQINEVEDTALYADSIYIINRDGAYVVGEEKDKLIDAGWEGEVLSYAYAGNFYVLEKRASTVWRYPAIEGGFASGQNWFASGVSPNLSGVADWTIDGSIWMLTGNGKILKFSLGNPENFSLSGVPGSTGFSAIYTNEELEHLYLLDNDNARVVVVDKEDGLYKAQYESESLMGAKDLVVSENEGKIIVLTGDKLQVLQIRHL